MYTLYKYKVSNLRPICFITFPQGFQKSKKVGHWTSPSGGNKTFKRSEQRKKKIRKKLSSLRQFYTLFEQVFSNLRPLLSITFPQKFHKPKKFGHWTSGSGGKKAVKRSEKHGYQKKSCSVRQSKKNNKKNT